jgi:predicted MFS family arabinose efflux permease
MTSAATTGAPAPVLRGNREFRLLWVGQALSAFGSSMSSVALPLVLLVAGHPVTAVAVVGTTVAVAGLAARLPAGFVSDRYDQRLLLIGCDLLQCAAIGSVAAWVAVRPLPLWPALVAVVLATGAEEVFKPAQMRLVRQVVDTRQIPSAVALNQARGYAAEIAGPAAGGLLVSLGSALPFTLDALTFLFSAVCVTMIRRPAGGASPPEPKPESGRQERLWRRFTAGWRHLAVDPFLRRSSLYFSGMTVVFTAFGSALVLGVGSEPGGARAVGWAVSTAGVAGLLGSLAAPRLQRALPLRVVVTAGPVAAALLLVTAWLTGGTLAFVAGFSAVCLLIPAINATVASVIAVSVPEEIYGRVATANDFVVQSLQPLGPLAAGLLVSRSLSLTALMLAACFAVLAALAVTLPAPGSPRPARSTP